MLVKLANDDREGFNTQPPEGGWSTLLGSGHTPSTVSTHSRPKAAGFFNKSADFSLFVSTHSRPKAAGKPKGECLGSDWVSTHSRPKAAGN